MRRNISGEAMLALAELRLSGSQTSFSTTEVAHKLEMEAWKVRKSLKKMAEADYPLIWSEGNDRWCVDARVVKICKVMNEIKLGDNDD